jgi:diguanylate cyclase (GGDEF)-like protein
MFEKKEKYSILIVDDEKMNLDILGGILSPTYHLLVSRNGPKALELAREQKPDLILLDIIMPEMSGFTVITELKKSDITAEIPVIFITGLTSSDDEEKGFFLGAVDYITKPFNKSIVKARVNTHIKIIDQIRTIEQIGLIDTVTKIPNRRGFEERLYGEWGRAQRDQTPISLLIMDIDNFKNYNDTYGHPQGDVALTTFAETVSKALRRPMDYIARWGGEEFVVLLPGTDIEGAAKVAENIREIVESTVIPSEEGVETRVTVSVGVNSIVPEADGLLKKFIERADQALYSAKESGRNRIVLYEVQG